MKLKNITLGQLFNIVSLLLATTITGAFFLVVQERSAVTQSPTVITGDSQEGTKRSFKLKLTLTEPLDLKVREGDSVVTGQVIADRVRDRQRLTVQKQRAEGNLKRLQSRAIPSTKPIVEPPTIGGLPAPSFMSEVAAIDRAKLTVAQAQAHVDLQHRKLDLLKSMPETPAAVIPHEERKLQEKFSALDQAEAELAQAHAKLALAQSMRQHEEYMHGIRLANQQQAQNQQVLEVSRQEQANAQAEIDRNFQISQIEQQIATLENQLIALAQVRSPYAGKVLKIKWEGQNDQALVVEVTLLVDGNQFRPVPTVEPSPTPEPAGTN